MDRKRLRNVQQTDLTEGRINDDFLYWLKTSGPNWLLAVLVVACIVMGWNWWKNRSAQARDVAWAELDSADIPSTLRNVAAKHSDVDAVAQFALLNAADQYLQSVVTGQRFDRDATATDALVTPELRLEWLNEADSLYSEVITVAKGKKSAAQRGFEIAALFGRAAVAESKSDAAGAKLHLEAAQSLAGTDLPWLAGQAKLRIDTLSVITTPYPIPAAPAPSELPLSGASGTVGSDADAMRLLLSDTPTAPAAPTQPASDAPVPSPAPASNP